MEFLAFQANRRDVSLVRFFNLINYVFFFIKKFLNFLFFIGVKLINTVVIVSGEQQRDSFIHIRVSILPQTPLPSRLPHNIEESFMFHVLYSRSLLVIHSKYSSMYMSIPNSLTISYPHCFPWQAKVHRLSLCLFLKLCLLYWLLS